MALTQAVVLCKSLKIRRCEFVISSLIFIVLLCSSSGSMSVKLPCVCVFWNQIAHLDNEAVGKNPNVITR